MPNLHIEFDATGGTLFQLKYRPLSSPTWTYLQITGSPIDIEVQTLEDYEYCITKLCRFGSESVPICGIAKFVAPCNIATFAFLDRVGNLFRFDYLLNNNQYMIDMEITKPSGGGTEIIRYAANANPTPLNITIQSITTGLYRFRGRGVCGNDSSSRVSDWSQFMDVNVIANDCAKPVTIVPIQVGSAPIANIKWADTNTSENRSGNLTSINVLLSVTDNDNDVTNQKLLRSVDNGVNWLIINPDVTSNNMSVPLDTDKTNKLKVIVTDAQNNIVTTDILSYAQSTVVTYPITNFYYRASHPEGHSGVDKVEYLDTYGELQEEILIRGHWEDDGAGGSNYVEPPCTLIQAYQIVSSTGCVSCIPD